MALSLDVVGMTHKYSQTYVVGREKIREFAKSIKCESPASHDVAAATALGHDGLVASLTFPAVMALLVSVPMTSAWRPCRLFRPTRSSFTTGR
ncbi:(3R)-hydroxyacyl-ACP dehydratase subunit HadC [Mycobacteroides abscessus subsp. abscessus]|nr:(3R)-hydroxyacyl-ACP dehydratase subunit HadC [Mycobacteroides abscessus subsp. abscessus]